MGPDPAGLRRANHAAERWMGRLGTKRAMAFAPQLAVALCDDQVRWPAQRRRRAG